MTTFIVTATRTVSEEEANRRLAKVYALLIGLSRKRKAADVGAVESQTTPAAIDAAPEEHDAKGV